MRFAQARDQRAARGRDGLAFGDGLRQPVEIGQNAIGGLADFRDVIGGERADALLEFLTRRRQNRGGVVALGLIRRGEKARCCRFELVWRVQSKTSEGCDKPLVKHRPAQCARQRHAWDEAENKPDLPKQVKESKGRT